MPLPFPFSSTTSTNGIHSDWVSQHVAIDIATTLTRALTKPFLLTPPSSSSSRPSSPSRRHGVLLAAYVYHSVGRGGGGVRDITIWEGDAEDELAQWFGLSAAVRRGRLTRRSGSCCCRRRLRECHRGDGGCGGAEGITLTLPANGRGRKVTLSCGDSDISESRERKPADGIPLPSQVPSRSANAPNPS